jgi:sugar phosphate isomerase/epimerase
MPDTTLRPGLCSVTFRRLDPEAVVEHASRHGLDGIEWGGDHHAPPGETERARHIRKWCMDSGVEVTSYGSYVYARTAPDDVALIGDIGGVPHAWAPSLTTALELGAPNIRVIAGTRGSGTTSVDQRQGVADELRMMAADAADHGVTISLEFHAHTLTDSAESTIALLREVGHPALFAYWQPRDDLDAAGNLAELDALGLRVSNVHVFTWRSFVDRQPLADGAALWPVALAHVAALPAPPTDRWALLEFVRDDDVGALAADAATLRSWLRP